MIRFLADEDFDHRILRGIKVREASLDIITIQDAGRRREGDPANLDFAASQKRVLLTHDKRLIPFVVERVEAGKSTPGVFIVQREAALRRIIEDLLLLALYSLEGEWEGQVLFVPLG